jgi:arginyl-tRNA synthetase
MKERINQKIARAISDLQEAKELPVFVVPTIEVTRPKDDQFGDYASNIALVLAKFAQRNPVDIAGMICRRFGEDTQPEGDFEKIAVAAPGYINFTLSRMYLSGVAREVLEKESTYGATDFGMGKRVNNEFISANPTGPLHLGNGRGGFFGDSLSRVLRKAGYEVTNEYYVNDAGEQILKLGHSILKDDEAVYTGEYIDELQRRLAEISQEQSLIRDGKGMGARETGSWAAGIVLGTMIHPTLSEKMNVHFDRFVSERKDILETGWTEKALAILQERGKTFEAEDAVWLRTTEYGDDKDRVLVKADGMKTYFASDCGYILEKMNRAHLDGRIGFDTMIETWGADHHGYVNRFRAAAQALGFAGELRFNIVQLVRLMKDGEEFRMSKREGNVVSIDELVEKVGKDVTRFFFLMYSADTHMNFDLGLAEERSQKNPVFYVQYAHARIASILRKASEKGLSPRSGNLELLVAESERALLRELEKFPELIALIATEYSVHRLPQYAIRLAEKFHSFYNECTVADEEHRELSEARLALITATKTVLHETLFLLGVDAPEKM